MVPVFIPYPTHHTPILALHRLVIDFGPRQSQVAGIEAVSVLMSHDATKTTEKLLLPNERRQSVSGSEQFMVVISARSKTHY
jgi:hypothetical protein